MCGFAGILNFSKKPVATRDLREMSHLLEHRGPDDSHLYTSGSFGVCHQRLAITDPSSKGRQPMTIKLYDSTIAYNGEVYNYRDLRRELLVHGYSFCSDTDTEVVIHGIHAKGPQFLEKMNGMFAFAIWDNTKKELLLARDRLGIKPLYYYRDEHCLIFSSEIKPILYLLNQNELNMAAAESYFRLRYVADNQTLFKNIFKLEPGTYLQIKSEGELRQVKYWDIQNLPRSHTQKKKELYSSLQEIFTDSVRSMVPKNQATGTFLSGGVDSSAITSLLSTQQLDTISYTYKMPQEWDESEQALSIAKLLGIQNRVVESRDLNPATLNDCLWHLEEPLGDMIILPTYLLSQTASQSSRVVLIGEGADEIFGGYVHHYIFYLLQSFFKFLPSPSKTLARRMLKSIPHPLLNKLFPYPGQLGANGRERLSHFLANSSALAQQYLAFASVFDPGTQFNIFTRDFAHSLDKHSHLEDILRIHLSSGSKADPLNEIIKLDLCSWLPNYNLLRTDKLTMAHSLEARVPFLDHRLVELALSVPGNQKMSFFNRKPLLRKFLSRENILPKNVLYRRKRPFYQPFQKQDSRIFKDFARDLLLSSSARNRGFYNPLAIASLIDSEANILSEKQLSSLVIFESWARLFLDGKWKNHAKQSAIRMPH